MTAQASDYIIYKGVQNSMGTEPLQQYLQKRSRKKRKKPIRLVAPHTACWRGYICGWEVLGSKLYLVDFKGFIENEKIVDINYVFPSKQKVFAKWFTGSIRIPQGEMLDYVHGGYQSLYEKDLFIKFKKGILISEEEKDNAKEFERRVEEYDDLPF